MNIPLNIYRFIFSLFFLGFSYSNFPSTKIQYVVLGDTLSQPYFRNLSLNDTHENIKYAVIHIHGSPGSYAYEQYNNMVTALSTSGMQDSTILIAPVFPWQDNIGENNLGDDVLFWSDSEWSSGDLSRNTQSNPRPFRISSYSTIDTIYHRLVENNANLKRIVLTGHSSGSQMVVRYAAGGRAPESLSETGVDFIYVPMNTSSFLYYNENRVLNEDAEVFEFGPSPCGSANQYRYGMDNLNQYMENTGEETIINNFQHANLTYLIAQYDFGGQTSTCARMTQGYSRLARTHIYFSYLNYFYGDTVFNTHRMAEIPGASHDHGMMIFTECGKSAVFGVGSCDLYVDPDDLFNQGPIAQAESEQIVNPGQLVTISATGSFDSDGTIETYSWTQVSGPPTNIEHPDSVVAQFIMPTGEGAVGISLLVFDNEGAFGADTIEVLINQPPTANAGGDQQVGFSSVVLLDASTSVDPDGGEISFGWTQIEGAPVTVFSNDQAVATFYSPMSGETLSFQLSIIDELGLTDKDTATVYVSSLAVTGNYEKENNPISLFPNPFNSSLSIGNLSGLGFKIEEIVVYNVVGKKITEWSLLNQKNKNQSVLWDGKDESGFEIKSGLYFVRFKGSKKSTTRKVTYLK